jgi:hypothetical protein
MDARALLFTSLIDYAGLFPPASRSIAEAVEEYRLARDGAGELVVGRFLVPASRLEELAAQAVASDWRLGVIAPAQAGEWGSAIEHYGGEGTIEALEIALPDGVTTAALASVFDSLPGSAWAALDELFVEVPGHRRPELLAGALETIADTRERLAAERPGGPALGAKIRCGGVTADAFPPEGFLFDFVTRCRQLGLPFKATAGLHHPLRVPDTELGVLQHGFLNLLAAAALEPGAASRVLSDADADAFRVDSEALYWRGSRVSASAARRLFRGLGSCSLTEPIDDLARLGMLAPASSARG